MRPKAFKIMKAVVNFTKALARCCIVSGSNLFNSLRPMTIASKVNPLKPPFKIMNAWAKLERVSGLKLPIASAIAPIPFANPLKAPPESSPSCLKKLFPPLT